MTDPPLPSSPPAKAVPAPTPTYNRFVPSIEDHTSLISNPGIGPTCKKRRTHPPHISTSSANLPLASAHLAYPVDLAEYAQLLHPSPLRLRGGGKGPKRRPDQRSHHPSRMKTRSSRTSPLTDLDKLKVEETAVQSEINRLNLALRDVEGDGNCLFRALSDQLWGDQKRHPEIRKLTCDYLESHEDELGWWAGFCSFLVGEDYKAYVTRMRKSGQYASEVEVHAAARMLKRDIRIIHSDHSETIPCEVESSVVHTPQPIPPQSTAAAGSADPSTPRRRTRSATSSLLSTPAAPPPSSPLYAHVLAQHLPIVKHDRSMLWLALFNDAEHYQSIRRKGDRDRGAAEVEDRLAEPHEKDMSEAARAARARLIGGSSAGTGAAQGQGQSKESSGKVKQVVASLPLNHDFGDEYIEGILARVKGDIGEAIEILISEMDIPEESSSDGGAAEDGLSQSEAPDMSVEVSRSIPSRQPPSNRNPTTANKVARFIALERKTPEIAYRQNDRPDSSTPPEPTSPSGSTTTSASQSTLHSDLSRSSHTTPSIGSAVSKRSSNSMIHTDRSDHRPAPDGLKRDKPYDKPQSRRPEPRSTRRKSTSSNSKQLSMELEDLKMDHPANARRKSRRRESNTVREEMDGRVEALREAEGG